MRVHAEPERAMLAGMGKQIGVLMLAPALTLSIGSACGGSSDSDGGSGGGTTGGSSGSGATGGGGGSGGSPGGAGGSGGSVTDGGYLECFDANGKLTAYDLKTCTSASTCVVMSHQTDCCGNTQLIGVEASKLAELQACEAAWVATLPGCGCPAGPPTTEQPAVTVSDPSAAEAVCGNYTMTSGVCFTQPKS